MTAHTLATRWASARWIDLPGFVRHGARLDIASAWVWPALTALALWPTWWWMGQRMVDGSDDPLGLLALAALAALVWRERRALRASPHLGLMLLALPAVLAVSLLQGQGPALMLALLAVLAMACVLIAFLPPRVSALPVLGLAVLALPLLASLQFYAGYPLRVLTAEASRWLLSAFMAVERSGSSMLVNGRLVIVDAPCSGVQMAWLGYFSACAVALYVQRSNREFLLRLPVVSVLVLFGNVLRNTVLVGFEGAGMGLSPLMHQALGLLVLASVCLGVAWVMARGASKESVQ
jgi:exosortase/archaeosortase family protein